MSSQVDDLNYVVDEKTGCWNWLGFLNEDGYGQHSARSETTPSGVTTLKIHRLFYEAHRGEIPHGLVLDHTCRNTSCVNPDHLEPVTNAENVRRGNSAKLTEEDASEIRNQYAAGGTSQLALANEYNVSERLIQMIVTGQAWVVGIENPKLSLNNKVGRPASLSLGQQQEVARRFRNGERNCDLAREFGISPSLVCRYVKLFPQGD